MFSRLPVPTFPAAPASRLSRCFATTPDGRIPVSRDWPCLLQQLSTLPEVACQTRHAFARLIALGPFPTGQFTDGVLDDAGASLRFDYDHWASGWARLQLCACCQSPGRFEFTNDQHAEFMQICAAADQAPADWAQLLAQFAAADPATLPELPRPPSTSYAMPVIPTDAVIDRAPFDGLIPLLSALGDAAHPVAVTLQTAAVLHRRVFVPRQVHRNVSLLQVSDGRVTLQLHSPAGTFLGRETTADGDWLHVVGHDNTLLLSLTGGAADGPVQRAWTAGLATLFPT